MEDLKTNVAGLTLKPVEKEDLSTLRGLLYELAEYEHLEDIFDVAEDVLEESLLIKRFLPYLKVRPSDMRFTL